MRVTKKQYPMDKMLVKKMDMFIKRCTQNKPALDAMLIIDGREGYGKTTLAVSLAHYFAEQTGREFSEANCFFDVDELLKYATSTENKILVWDEAALMGMAAEWQNKVQIKLNKVLMTARKKRHLWIFNIPKSQKLNEYLFDRALGLIHVYARDDIEVGRFTYYNYKAKSTMYQHFRKTRVMNYKRNVSFRGSFADVLDANNEYNILDTFDAKKYDDNKNKAIMSIMDEEDKGMTRYKKAYYRMQFSLAQLCFHFKEKYGLSYEQLEKISGQSRVIMIRGLKIIEKYPEILETETETSTDKLRQRGREFAMPQMYNEDAE